MKPDPRFAKQEKSFWACVRSISQTLKYTVRGEGRIKVHTPRDMRHAFVKLNLDPDIVASKNGTPTELGKRLHDYFQFRAAILEKIAAKKLMNATQAQALFERFLREYKPRRPSPMNKQKGKKKAPAFLTALVNMSIERYSFGAECDYDPQALTTITKDGVPLRTLARRVDGAFPNAVNPVAIWEIKEYYYTTTFGSRVADGVYELLLDGLELEELRESTGVDIKHYLIVDAYDTWWHKGRSYLCRIVDMLHMGYVDEVLFGAEVVDEMPRIVGEWMMLAKQRTDRGAADPPASP